MDFCIPCSKPYVGIGEWENTSDDSDSTRGL